ncbi:sensor histidine kinase [Cohnella lubricantis]|uniref:histidine kinase n=1 Tax=Cohnella lubricantis TaxID=2163172 RepID=A0A841T405_9BACL|nr:sensor histidine kinase [Cohnella lubricantis]MBB6676074.1 sensor histidine kinase [Cohnella lubricantis]MBP2118029.1 signal transduction histidine kinase [Cohnella lubricantis]
MNFRFYGKPLASAAAIFLLMYINRLFHASLPQTVLHLAIWATLSGILFITDKRWTPARRAASASILSIECAIGIAWFHEVELLYFIAIYAFAVILRRSVRRTLAPLIAGMVLTAFLYSRFGSSDLFDLLSYALLAAVLYFFIRSRMQRNAMYEVNQKQLAELQDAYVQLQEASATAMQNAVLQERTRIAREMHDSVGHSLTSMIVQLQAMRYMLRENPERAAHSLEELLSVARQGLTDIRTSIHALADDQSMPGVSTLESLLARTEASSSIRCRLKNDLNGTALSAETVQTLFRVLQEALTNVIRHSRATIVDVELRAENGNVEMRIRDNGELGLDRGIPEGFGLRSMRARLEEMGGSLIYRAVEPSGFEIVAVVPNEEVRLSAGSPLAKEE